jgi:L,D-transpeptidase catalytic domain
VTARTALVCAAACLAAFAPGARGTTPLSNLRTETLWAYPTRAALVRSSPIAAARTVGRLRFLTVDGQAELYVALASTQQPGGQTWIQIEVPGRPNGRTGWVPRSALGAFQLVREYLRVDERRLRATLYREGTAIFQAPVGIGKPSTVTPKGRFYVLEKLVSVGAPAYGPFALGTSAYAPTLSEWPGGGVVGIHGTNEPQQVPGRPSHGCIRMHDPDIARLWHLIALGTPIEIS